MNVSDNSMLEVSDTSSFSEFWTDFRRDDIDYLKFDPTDPKPKPFQARYRGRGPCHSEVKKYTFDAAKTLFGKQIHRFTIESGNKFGVGIV